MQRFIQIFLLGSFVWCLYAIVSPLYKGRFPLNLGLDLAGGVIVEYQPDFGARTEGSEPKSEREILEICKDILTNRLSRTLKTVPDIYIRDDNRLIVSIPSVDNYQQALALVGKTYQLSMRLVLEDSPEPIEGPGVYQYRGHYYKLDKAAFTGDMLDERKIQVKSGDPQSEDPDSRSPGVDFSFRPPFDSQFQEFTRTNVNRQLAILVDENIEVLSTIRSEIDETATLTGNYTIDEARDHAILLRSGTLPVPLKMVGLSGVGPSLGQEIQSKGLIVLLVSIVSLFLLMFLVYTHRIWFLLAGAVSLLTLLFFLVGFAAAFHFTLDTTAIAGIILSLAMGVDAFIIVFESLEPRLRHFSEKELGRVGYIIVDKIYSFRQQGSVLLHPNLTILLIVLLLLQSDRLQSFALFMCLGIGASILTIFVTRNVLLKTFSIAANEGPDLVARIRHAKPGLFRFRKPYLIAFAVLVLIYVAMCFRHPGTLGISLGADFTPGAEVLCEAPDEKTVENSVHNLSASHPEMSARYQKLTQRGASDRYLITLALPNASTRISTPNDPDANLPSFGGEETAPKGSTDTSRELTTDNRAQPVAPGTLPSATSELPTESLLKSIFDSHIKILSFYYIDSKVSASRLFRSLALLPLSCAILLLYFVMVEPRINGLIMGRQPLLTMNPLGRFEVASGIVLSAVHDIIVMLFVCAVFHLELSLTVIAAILTIVGYSVMDSVVIWNYVRARAEGSIKNGQTFDPVRLVSDGIDATFSRVVLTGISTLIPVIAILVVNIPPLRDFALLIAVGTVSGTLSSIFIVGPFAAHALSFNTPRTTYHSTDSALHPLKFGPMLGESVEERLEVLD